VDHTVEFSEKDRDTVKRFSELLRRLGFSPEACIPLSLVRTYLGNPDLSCAEPEKITVEIKKNSHAFPTLGEVERKHIMHTMKLCGSEYKIASRLLGINRSTLYRKMKKYGIDKSD
jgi:transcriptional regulator of acetoin/glycerol metabolism